MTCRVGFFVPTFPVYGLTSLFGEKFVALRAVLMRAMVWMNNVSVLLDMTVDTQVACLSGAAGSSACRAVRTVRTVRVAAPPEHRQWSQEEQPRLSLSVVA